MNKRQLTMVTLTTNNKKYQVSIDQKTVWSHVDCVIINNKPMPKIKEKTALNL